MRVQRLIAAVVVVAVGLVQAPAWAGEPATQNSVQLGVGFRYGIEMNDGDFNPWGVGLGLDGGYTLPNAVYVGGNFDYFFGDSVEAGGSKLTANVWQLMAEGGYDIGLGPFLVIRPKLGAGLGTMGAELCVDSDCTSDSTTKFALAPGVKAMLFLPHFGLSVDLRYAMIFSDRPAVDPAPGAIDRGSSGTDKAVIFSVGVGF